MTKNIIAVIAAPLIWGLIMLPGNQIIFQFFPEALQGQLSSAYLFSALIASFFYSAIAGGWDIDYADGIPSVAVLDGEGELLTATRDGELRTARSLNPIQIATQVHRWLPEPTD